MSHPRHNLPVVPNRFVGRERDVTDLDALLRSTRLVTLTGAGGIGKSRLAGQVAHQVLSRFDDGACLVDLSGCVSAEDVTVSVSRALGVAEDSALKGEDAILTVLRSRCLLLILDTCERVVGPVARLCHLLLSACPELRILATSRESLRIPGEAVWRVPPMSLPSRHGGPPRHDGRKAEHSEAVRLFTVRAQDVRPDFSVTGENVETIVEICQILDGIPLAIELAAARMRVLSLRQILRRLDDRFRLLVTSGRDLPARQQALRTTVEWSYELLTEAERVLLGRLSIFAGWTLDMAEEVCASTGIPREDVLDLHASLVDKSFIVRDSELQGEVRYRMLDTIRAYVREVLPDSTDEDACYQRFLEFTIRCLEEVLRECSGVLPWRQRVAYLRRFDTARENVDSLLAWALRNDHIHAGLRICAAMRPYWTMRGLCGEGGDRIRAFLDACDSTSIVPDRFCVRAFVLYAELCMDQEDLQTAVPIADKGLALAREYGTPEDEARALAVRAVVALRAEDGSRGERYARSALELARAGESGDAEEFALSVLARWAVRQRDLPAVQRYTDQIAELAAARGDRWTVARCQASLGAFMGRSGDAAAVPKLEAALTVFEEVESLPDIARCVAGLGRLALARNDFPTARHRLAEALRQSVASGRRLAIVRVLESLADLAIAEEQPERAAFLGGAAISLGSGLASPALSRYLSYAQACLGAETAEEVWREARTLGLDEVVSTALAYPPLPGEGEPDRRSGAALTPRELEIAHYVGDGLSNRDIAERLVIRPATVARHVANIFGKLGFTSRSQLASWSVRNRTNP